MTESQSFNAREGLGWFVTGISSSTTTGEPRLFCFNAREGLGWFVTVIKFL